MPRLRAFLATLMSISVGSSAAVFQYSVSVATAGGERDAFLWIPHEARQVRGIVMAGMTLMEREMVKDPLVRKACAEQQLALLFVKTGLGSIDLQQTLDSFARVSGYREISQAPLFFVGHSAGGPQAQVRAVEFAERCFGLMQYRGGGPFHGDKHLPPGIPSLMMVGQFDEFGGTMRHEDGREHWEGVVEAAERFRTADEGNLLSVVVEPGAGHFAWSERNAAYFAMFLRKAAAARIPAEWPVDEPAPPRLLKIDRNSGWLSDLRFKSAGRFPPAAYGEYQGAKTAAQWHFDRQMAEATVAYHKGLDRSDQFIRWKDPVFVDAGARFFFSSIQWVGDGQTFEVHPVYADQYPGQYDGNGPIWPKAGQPVGNSGTPIRVKVVGGPIAVADAEKHQFRLQFDGLAPPSDMGRVTFMAYSEGDERFRYTEQVGMLPRGFKGLNLGKDQAIRFAPLQDLKAGGAPQPLKALSDSGQPVEFYVAYGPAQVADGLLRVCELPVRTSYPVSVKVVAYQAGRGVEPRLKMAEPVEQIIRIVP